MSSLMVMMQTAVDFFQKGFQLKIGAYSAYSENKRSKEPFRPMVPGEVRQLFPFNGNVENQAGIERTSHAIKMRNPVGPNLSQVTS